VRLVLSGHAYDASALVKPGGIQREHIGELGRAEFDLGTALALSLCTGIILLCRCFLLSTGDVISCTVPFLIVDYAPSGEKVVAVSGSSCSTHRSKWYNCAFHRLS